MDERMVNVEFWVSLRTLLTDITDIIIDEPIIQPL